jgi:hypothetical protein
MNNYLINPFSTFINNEPGITQAGIPRGGLSSLYKKNNITINPFVRGITSGTYAELAKGISFYIKAIRDNQETQLKNYLSTFFGPTGPGYNYGATGSEEYVYTNLNGISPISNYDLTMHRFLYRTYNQGEGLSASNYFTNFLSNSNVLTGNPSSQTPGIIPINII